MSEGGAFDFSEFQHRFSKKHRSDVVVATLEPSAPSAPLSAAENLSCRQTCCEAANEAGNAILCSLCKIKSYCSNMCKLSDMVFHRKVCQSRTDQQHVYAYCGVTLSEAERVMFLKTLPKVESMTNKSAAVPPHQPPQQAVATAAAMSSLAVLATALRKDELIQVVEQIMELPESFYFLELPNSALYPDYFEKIADPISLRQILIAAKRGRYDSSDVLLIDLDRMARNAADFNGENSHIAGQARFLQARATISLRCLSCNVCNTPRRVKIASGLIVPALPLQECKGCQYWQCSRCGPCNCKLLRHKAIRIQRNFELVVKSARSWISDLAELSGYETGILAQILAEERPDLFDVTNDLHEVLVELTPNLEERIKSLLL